MMEISEKKLFFRLWKLFLFGAKFSPALKPEIFLFGPIFLHIFSLLFNSYGVQTPSCTFDEHWPLKKPNVHNFPVMKR